MARVHHVNVVGLFGVALDPLAMLMELCEAHSLDALLYEAPSSSPLASTLPPISERFRARVALDIARGVAALHGVSAPPIVHRDLRSPNILLVSFDDQAPLIAKVADLGLARQAAPHLSEMLGTWQWCAPMGGYY